MWSTGLVALLLAMGAAHPRNVPFVHLTAEEQSALRQEARQSKPAAPAIELLRRGKKLVVYATLGQKPVAGHKIEITRITAANHTLVVMARVTAPSRGSTSAQVLSYPLDAVWISAASLPRARSVSLELVDQEGRRLAQGQYRK